jgi:hypothetical protein
MTLIAAIGADRRNDPRTTKHVLGLLVIDVAATEPAQVTAALGLMRKVLPDLVNMDARFTGEVHRFAYAIVPEVMEKAEWLRTRGNPQLPPRPSDPVTRAQLSTPSTDSFKRSSATGSGTALSPEK